MKKLCILGSTGSIGTQTLDICRQYPEDFEILALSAKSNIYLLAEQIKEFKPKRVCLYDEDKLESLQELLEDLDYEVKIHIGEFGLLRLVKMLQVDIVVNALVGFAGFEPTLEALKNSKDVALANKESLVVGGHFIMRTARENKVQVIPIDSEHSAIFQSINGNNKRDIKSIILTASGGPFYGRTKDELKTVTVEQALKHPNWSMGAKVTIDSATMMNKGLELIEACWLFNVNPNNVEIVVHPESIVHSMVEYVDNSTIAQLSMPDMKIPIQYSLTYPNRYDTNTKKLSLVELGKLTFKAPDEETFVCLKACKEAIRRGGAYPAIVNGANEEAVSLFLQKKIDFEDIGTIVLGSLDVVFEKRNLKVEDIITADKIGRNYAKGFIKAIKPLTDEVVDTDEINEIDDIVNKLKLKKAKKVKKSKRNKKDKKDKKDKDIVITDEIEENLQDEQEFYGLEEIDEAVHQGEVVHQDEVDELEQLDEIEEIEEVKELDKLDKFQEVNLFEPNDNDSELQEINLLESIDKDDYELI